VCNAGKVGPCDTYRGFRDIGFGIILSLYAAIVIPLAMGWLTNDSYEGLLEQDDKLPAELYLCVRVRVLCVRVCGESI
jgi:hypothetical protein